MKYDSSLKYIFYIEFVCDGIKAKQIEKEFENKIKEIKKSCQKIFMSNDVFDDNYRKVNVFNTIQELNILKNKKIIHIGTISEKWKQDIIEEMENKKEINEKRKMHLDDCIVVYLKEEEEKEVMALIIDSKHIYSIVNNQTIKY